MLAVVIAPSINDGTVPDLRRSSLLYGLAALWLLLWTMVAMVEFARYLHGSTGPTWRLFVTILIEPAIVGAWLACVIAARKFESPAIDPPRAWFRHHLRVLPVLALACPPIVWGLRWGFYQLIDIDFGGPPIYLMVPFEGLKVALFYGLWLALMFGLLTLEKRREDSERLLGVQKALVEAQLAQLQAQLRPHFLFNALNTVSSLMQTDPARADRVLSELGDLLRANLGTTRRDSVPLQEEIKVLRKYTDIMQERFGERAVVTWNVASDVLDMPMPSMLLQPLLENAYKHGVERNTNPVVISIAAARSGNSLQVMIHNTGSTLNAEQQTTTAVGIVNCRERLRLLYGSNAALRLEEDGVGGVQAIVTIPCPAA